MVTKWEYMSIAMEGTDIGLDKLNEYGDEGWELVQIIIRPGQYLHNGNKILGKITFIFKRQKS